MSDYLQVKARSKEEKRILRRVKKAKTVLRDADLHDITFEALEKWLNNDFSEHRKQQIHFTTNSSQYRKDVKENLEKIRTRLKGNKEVKEENLRRIISEVVGRNGSADSRTVKKYIERMKDIGIIRNVKPAYKTILYEIQTDETEMLENE